MCLVSQCIHMYICACSMCVYLCVFLTVTQKEKKLSVSATANRRELFGRDEEGEGDEQVN